MIEINDGDADDDGWWWLMMMTMIPYFPFSQFRGPATSSRCPKKHRAVKLIRTALRVSSHRTMWWSFQPEPLAEGKNQNLPYSCDLPYSKVMLLMLIMVIDWLMDWSIIDGRCCWWWRWWWRWLMIDDDGDDARPWWWWLMMSGNSGWWWWFW